MVSKVKANNPLTIHERRFIKECLNLNHSYGFIAKEMARAKSTIIRECKRLGDFTNYDPDLAQNDFEEKQKNIGTKSNLTTLNYTLDIKQLKNWLK